MNSNAPLLCFTARNVFIIAKTIALQEENKLDDKKLMHFYSGPFPPYQRNQAPVNCT